ncbi:Tad domain-containing protein [bacterium]|nr:Tad domain-containing protein [bacterium]
MVEHIKKNPKKKPGQRGNAILYVAILMPVLIGFAGLVTDYGRGVYTKTQLQRAADAGALAGASYIPNETEAHYKAAQLVAENYDNVIKANYVRQGDDYTVELETSIPTFFMRFFGHYTMEVYAEATAITNVLVGGLTDGGFPFAVINPDLNNDPSDDLSPANWGRRYILQYGEDNVIVGDWANGSDGVPHPEGTGQGWRGALGLNMDGTLGWPDPGFSETGADDIAYNFINGWPGTMEIGDSIPQKPGNMASLAKAIGERLGSNPLPYSEFDPHLDGSDPRVVLVPIVHMINPNRMDTYTVQDYNNGVHTDKTRVVIDGFAPFFLLTSREQGDVDGDGNSNDRDWCTGIFLPPITINNYIPGGPGTPDFGMFATPRLSN